MRFLNTKTRWRNLVIFIFLSGTTFFLITFFSRIHFILQIASQQTSSLYEGIKLFIQAWYWTLGDLSILQTTINIFIALLFGANMFALSYLLQMQKSAVVSFISLLNIGAFASALAGIFCLSCGSLIIFLVPAFISISSVALLPLGGAEFGFVSIILLCVSLWISHKMKHIF